MKEGERGMREGEGRRREGEGEGRRRESMEGEEGTR